jgi:hypothetical protein
LLATSPALFLRALVLTKPLNWMMPLLGSLGAVLNAFAGVLNVLAKTVGSVATDPGNNQKAGDE